MLTRITDEDWESVVQVFRAVRSRGDEGWNDRILGPTLHPARPWATKDTTARAIAGPSASAVSAR